MATIPLLNYPTTKVVTIPSNIDYKDKFSNRNWGVYFNGMNEDNYESVDISYDYFKTSKNVVNKRPNFEVTPRAIPQPEISKYHTEQAYEGTVLSINSDGTFTARLVDLTRNGPDEEGEFNLTELNGDESLVTPGSQFTWVIGIQKRGSKDTRVSEIRFRRLPAFTKEALERAKAKALETEKYFTNSYDRDSTIEIDL